MSLPRTPSRSSLTLSHFAESLPSDSANADSEKEKEKANAPHDPDASSTRLGASPDAQPEKTSKDSDDAPTSPRSPRSGGSKPRTMLRVRERSISNPVLLRPLATASSTSASPPTNQSATQIERLPSTPPQLQPRATDSGSSSHKSSNPQAQLSELLVEFIDQQILRKKAEFNEEIPIDSLPKPLQSRIENSGRKAIYLSDLMKALFREDMKTSDAWRLASDMAVKIKNNFLVDARKWQSLHEPLSHEESVLLHSCAENFAGAFFNLSTDHKLQRLPESLLSFMQAADHRLIRALLASGDGLKIESEEFARKRRDLLSSLLLDNFLVPVIQDDIFTTRGIFRSDLIVGKVINALHRSVHDIAPAFLSRSITNAPPEVVRVIAHRRISQFQQRHTGDKQLHGGGIVVSTGNSTTSHPLLSPRNRGWDRRIELKNHLESLRDQMHASKADLPEDLLQKIKQHNNELAASGSVIDQLSAWSDWLVIAKHWNAEHPATQLITRLHAELSEFHHDQQLIDQTLQKIDRHGNIITTTSAITTTTAVTATTTTTTTLSTTTATTTTTLTTAMIAPGPGRAVVDTLNSSDDSSARKRQALTRMPRKVRENSSESSSSSALNTSPSSSFSSSHSPFSASPIPPVTRHKRSHTADAHMPIARPGAPQLSASELQALQAAFPQLMVKAFIDVTKRHPHNAIQSIVEVGRHKFMLGIADFLQPLQNAVVSLERPQVMGHAELLKILFMDTLKASPAGQVLISSHQEALQSMGKVPSVFSMESSSNSEFVRNEMTKKAQPMAAKAVAALFGNGLKNAGLPPALLDLWMKVDDEITSWAGNTADYHKNDLDYLRSATGFDLLVTRLLYPLALGIDDGSPSVAAVRFADGIRKEIENIWPKIFLEFKQLSAPVVTSQLPERSTTGSPGSGASPQHSPDKMQ